jgi:hypothetical protein
VGSGEKLFVSCASPATKIRSGAREIAGGTWTLDNRKFPTGIWTALRRPKEVDFSIEGAGLDAYVGPSPESHS